MHTLLCFLDVVSKSKAFPSHGAMPANRCLYMHAISSLCLSIAVIMTSSCAARNLIYIIYSQNDQLYAAL